MPMRRWQRRRSARAYHLPSAGRHRGGTACVWSGPASAHQPRPVKALRYRLKTTIQPHTERISCTEEEAGCFVLLTNVPMAGTLAHSARDILTVYKEQHGTEQNYGFLKDPVIVNSLFLKKPERIEALG